MDKLMTLMFGDDFLEYSLDIKKTCHVHDDYKPKFVFNRAEWLSEYENMIVSPNNMTTDETGGFLIMLPMVLSI